MYARTHARYHKQTDGLTDGQRALADIDISPLFLSQTRILCPLSDSLLFAPLLKVLLPSPDRDAVRMMRNCAYRGRGHPWHHFLLSAGI